MRRAIVSLWILLIVVSSGVARAEQPRREDVDDLIVLHLYGSYREMGRQQAELLGPDLREVFEYQLADYRRLLARAGVGGRLFDRLLVPLYSGIAPMAEESGLHEEVAGMAAGLRLPPRQMMRAMLSLSAGSTVFAATRGATADGQALIGRNVDWHDGFGRRRPLVAFYHPEGDDLDYLFVGWPLVGLPTVGLNQAGLAISFNFFVCEPQVSLFFPSWPHRRALQKATTVEEAIRIISEPGRRGIAAFLVLADAEGEIAMVECTPGDCAVYRPDGDWFAQANHARTEPMIPHDRFRHPDSFLRRSGMEDAVRPHLGRLTPSLAAEILRDRGGERFANGSTVGNLAVLNPAIVHPASLTLWHSTTMQPHAPFGRYVPFTLDPKADPPIFSADESLSSGALDLEREEIEKTRRALELHRREELAEARRTWDALLSTPLRTLDARRLVFGSAGTRDALGDDQGAYDVLEPAADETAPIEVRGTALVARGILADRLGRRERAIEHYRAALELLATRPEFTAFAPLRDIAERGLESSRQATPLPLSPYDTGVPL
jgi:hypothetical protein